MSCYEKALANDTNAIRDYLTSGDINCCNEEGKSLLHFAARGAAMEVATILLENSININMKDKRGETAIFESVRQGRVGFTKLLCRYHADLNVVSNAGESLFFLAIKKGNTEILSMLLDEANLDFSLCNQNGENALFYALRAYNSKLFLDIARKYPELLEQRNYHNTNLLMLACQLDNYEVAEYLFKKKRMNLYELDNEKNNALFYAAKYASYPICLMFLEEKPIIEGKNVDGDNILEIASFNPHAVAVQFSNYRDSYYYFQFKKTFPYHIATVSRNYDLLDYGNYDKKKKDTNGLSILDYASMINDSNIDQILLRH